MKYLIIILLTLGCTNPFKSKSKPYIPISIDTYFNNNRYIFIIQDSISYVSETLNEYDLKILLENFKNVNSHEDKVLKYKSLNIKNLQDVVKEVFEGNVTPLKSTAYRYQKNDIMIVYDPNCEKNSKLEDPVKELESLKYNIKKEKIKKDNCIWHRFSFRDLAIYEAFIKEAEKLFNCI